MPQTEKKKTFTKNHCLKELQRVAKMNNGKQITRDFFVSNSTLPRTSWSKHFGTFGEFRTQAGLTMSRQQKAIGNQVARHSSVDHYRAMGKSRSNWGMSYIRETKSRFKTILGIADIHDMDVDRFWLRIVIDTAKRAQPDVICINGDLFDLPEFSRFTIDPREWNVVERIKFAHDHVLAPLRAACPNAQIDLIEGNHELRLLKHLADQSPAMRTVLSDLCGMTAADLFAIKKFEINYIAKADLAAYTKAEETKEIKKNWKLYYDSFIACHYSDARNMGYPGFSGHNHKHQVWNNYSPQFGSYEWHQFGSGCKRASSFCDGQKWANGFGLIHIDSKKKLSNIEYIPVTDHAVVGGQWYYREKNEEIS